MRMQELLLVSSLFSVASCCRPPPRSADLAVSHHVSVPVSVGEVDEFLRQSRLILESVDGPDDTSCPTPRLVRVGNLSVFTMGTGIVVTSDEFYALIRLPGYAKVVDDVQWCGHVYTHALGCASEGSFVVEHIDDDPVIHGVLWAHEYAHTKGLGHRETPRFVMREYTGFDNRRVDEHECEHIQD